MRNPLEDDPRASPSPAHPLQSELEEDYDEWYVSDGWRHACAIAQDQAWPSDDWESAVASALADAWRKFDELPRSYTARRAWLYQAIKYALGRQRRERGSQRKRLGHLVALDNEALDLDRLKLQSSEDASLDPESVALRKDFDQKLYSVLRELDEIDRKCFFLRHVVGVSFEEIAVQCNLKPRKVRSACDKVLKHIRRHWSDLT